LPSELLGHEDPELHRVTSDAEVLDSVINDREEVVITRAGHEPVVIMSLADFESMRETAYLMRSPANARRLLDAMERLEAGEGETRELIDVD
jgi:antitoxin YefM